jgi:hypothetical protein
MSIDELILPTRDQLEAIGRNAWLARHSEFNPDEPLDIGPGTQPYVLARSVVDVTQPVYYNAGVLGNATLIRGTFGTRLEERAKEMGLEGRLPATPSTGFAIAGSISDGGSTIEEGDILVHRPTGTRFEVITTKLYVDGEPIPIRALETGTSTNLINGSLLFFANQRPACSESALVSPQNDGTGQLVGLSGGREAETDEELQERMIDAQANPAAAGNNAEIIRTVEATEGVPVQKAWCISAWGGPGTNCVLFTLRPAPETSSRLPNAVQIQLVEANLRAAFPSDFGLNVGTLLPLPTTFALSVTWRNSVTGWADPIPWPIYDKIGNDEFLVKVVGIPAPTTSTMRVSNVGSGSYPSPPSPQPGMSIAIFDIGSRQFKIKRIAAIAEITPGITWDLTFDMNNGASDLFVPKEGAIVSPWSSSLNLLPSAILKYFTRLGPGEQFTVFYDDGQRRRRFPRSPDEWPNVLTNTDLVSTAKGTGAVSDAEVLLPNTPYQTPAGVPGVFSYLLQFQDIGVYPQT